MKPIYIMAKALSREGRLSTIWGNPRAGKTSMAVFLMRYMVELGYEIWTNIPFFDYDEIDYAKKIGRLADIPGHKYIRKPPEIHTITKFSELLLGLLSTKLSVSEGIYRTMHNVVILDEGGLFASSTSATSKQVTELKKMAMLIGHLNAALILIAQSKGSIIPALREQMVEIEIRIRRERTQRVMSIAYGRPGKDEYDQDIVTFEPKPGDTYARIPPAKYPFDSKAMVDFSMDLPFLDISKKLGGINSVKLLKTDDNGDSYGVKLIRELMDDDKIDKVGTKESKTKKNQAFELIAAGLKPKQIAEKLGISINQARVYQTQYRGLIN